MAMTKFRILTTVTYMQQNKNVIRLQLQNKLRNWLYYSNKTKNYSNIKATKEEKITVVSLQLQNKLRN